MTQTLSHLRGTRLRCVWFLYRAIVLSWLGAHLIISIAAMVSSLCPWISCEDGTLWTWTGPPDASREFRRYVKHVSFCVPILLVVLSILLLWACFAWHRRVVNYIAIWLFGSVGCQLSMAVAHHFYFLGTRSDGTHCTFTWGYDLWVYSSLNLLSFLAFWLVIDSWIPANIEFEKSVVISLRQTTASRT